MALERVCNALLASITEQALLEVEVASATAQTQTIQGVAEALRAEITRLGPIKVPPRPVITPTHHSHSTAGPTPTVDRGRFQDAADKVCGSAERLLARLRYVRGACARTTIETSRAMAASRDLEEKAFRAVFATPPSLAAKDELLGECQRRILLIASEESKVAHLECAVVPMAQGAQSAGARKALDLCVEIGTLLGSAK